MNREPFVDPYGGPDQYLATAIRFITLLCILAALSSCDNDRKPFWFTRCEGSDFRDVAKDSSYGDYPTGVVVRLTDQLILAPPKNFYPHYIGEDPTALKCTRLADLPQVSAAQFSFRASSLGGYENSQVPGSYTSDTDVVLVTIQRDPEGAATSTSSEYERWTAARDRPTDQSDEFIREVVRSGLRCYGLEALCFGSSVEGQPVNLRLVAARGWFSVVLDSPKYAGVSIEWTANGANILRWKAITNQIPIYLDRWNARRQQ
jgi:hypothetical protein